jgi:uncharacterized membrane protein
VDEIGTTAGVMWDQRGDVTPLPGLDGWDSFPNAINEFGEAVGGSGPYAVIWTRRPVGVQADVRTVPGPALRVAGGGARAARLPAWLEAERRQCSRAGGVREWTSAECLAAP